MTERRRLRLTSAIARAKDRPVLRALHALIGVGTGASAGASG
jgi:hypothetical protein